MRLRDNSSSFFTMLKKKSSRMLAMVSNMYIIKLPLLFLFLFLLNFSKAQELKLNKKIITDLPNLDFQGSLKNKNRLFKAIAVHSDKQGKSFSLGRNRPITLAEDEEFLHMSGDTFYKIKYRDQWVKEMVKYVGNSEVARGEFSQEGALEILNEEGYFLSSDALDGNVISFMFYSPDLIKLSEYKPYGNSGSNWTKYAYNNKVVCIYAQDDYKSDAFKLAILDHKGNLLKEREFKRGFYNGSNVNIVGDKVVLTLTSSKSGEIQSKVHALDMNLDILWSKESQLGIIGTTLKYSIRNNSLVLITHQQISYVNASTGDVVWSVPTNDLIEFPYVFKMITVDHVLSDEYLAVSIGEFQKPNNSNRREDVKLLNNILTLINSDTGEKVYRENLGDIAGDKWIEIVGSDYGFVVIKNSVVSEYGKQ